jgi:arylsulfatase A-like enzyme
MAAGWSFAAVSLHEAVQKNDFTLVKTSIRTGQPINGKDKAGFTPLAYAVPANVSTNILDFLLANGATVPILDGAKMSQETALLYAAAAFGRREHLVLLMARGADGQSGPAFDGLNPGGPAFQPDGSLEYLGIRNDVLYRVKQAAPATPGGHDSAVPITAGGPGSAAPNPARPNILFIMSDDHAAHAISAYSGRINQTPNLDRLAREGVRFDRCYAVNSICSPSRATILTGKYSHLNGVPAFNRFDGSQPTVAKYLQAAGYHTGMIGKWHLGSDPTGFDYWIVLPGQGVYQDPVFLSPAGRKVIQGYVTDIITDLSIEFLKNRPKDRPFFLMCHHKAPHRPWDPDAKHAQLYADRDIPEPPTLWDDYVGRADAARETTMTIAKDLTHRDLKIPPPSGTGAAKWNQAKPMELTVEVNGQRKTLTGDELVKWKYQKYIKDYLRTIASVDDNVGRLLDFLEQEKLADNTLVIYTSDQGFFLGDHGWYDKRFMYEESIKMPFLVRWPRVIKPGTTQAALALNVDFAPTFLDAAGLPPAPGMQGRSLLPLWRGQRPADWRTSWYYRYYHDPGDHNTRAHYGVGTETHKLIYFWKKNQWELYDLVKDPEELHNIYSDPSQADLIAKLKKELYRLKDELQDKDQFADKLPPPGVDAPPPKAARPAPSGGG